MLSMLIQADWERDGSFSELRMDRGEALSEIMNIKKMLKMMNSQMEGMKQSIDHMNNHMEQQNKKCDGRETKVRAQGEKIENLFN